MAILAGGHHSQSAKVRHFPLASENLKIISHNLETVQGGKLILITNRKSYTIFRLVPKSVTLNDLKLRNGCYIALFFFGTRPYFLYSKHCDRPMSCNEERRPVAKSISAGALTHTPLGSLQRSPRPPSWI